MKKYLKLTPLLSVIFVLILLIQACRKYDSSKSGTIQFKMEDAKEWYYGEFKKSSSFKQIDRSSVFAPDQLSVEVKKYPYWDKSIEYSIGGLQVVEMPVVRSFTQIPLAGSSNLTENEQKQIAESSIEKVVFLKTKQGNPVVRLLIFMPDIEYLRIKNFDISHNTMANPDSDFSGYIIVKEWDESIISFRRFKKGKYIKNVKIERMTVQEFAHSKVVQNNSAKTLSSDCGWQYTPIYLNWLTEFSLQGDDPNATAYGSGSVYRGEVAEYIDCGESNSNPYDGCMSIIGMSEVCACEVFGYACDGGGGGGGGGNDGQSDGDVMDQIETDLQDSCFQAAFDKINNAASLGNDIGSILHETFTYWNQHDLYVYQKCISDTAEDARTTPSGGLITIALNECALQNASQEYVAATIYHEILHAYFFAHDRNSGLTQHSDMANKYINAMTNTLMEYFPNLSYQDAEALSWRGLENTQAWQDLVQNDPGRALDIEYLNNKHKRGDWGTKCQ